MASIYPDFETISKLRVRPTEGELTLLRYLYDKLDDSYDLFFNPYLDGDRPDIIILKKNYGVVIIEVKDWNLAHNEIDENNKWSVWNDNRYHKIKSPHQQVYKYKSNMFNLHIPLLGLKEAVTKGFYNVINVFVYFHSSREKLEKLYARPLLILRNKINTLNNKMKNKEMSYEQYDKQLEYLNGKKRKIERDLSYSITSESLPKLIRKIKDISNDNRFTIEVVPKICTVC
jgi:hypothetical protein